MTAFRIGSLGAFRLYNLVVYPWVRVVFTNGVYNCSSAGQRVYNCPYVMACVRCTAAHMDRPGENT